MRNTKVAITGCVCICVIEVLALLHGYNGTLITMSIAALAGIAGYNIKGRK